RAVKQVVKTHVSRLKVEGSGLIGRWHQKERDVLLQRTASQNIEPAEVESGLGEPGYTAGGIGRDLVRALPAPEWRDTQCDRPVGRVLPNWRILVVHQLVAVVFEFLAEKIEHGPGLMTGGTTQTVLAGKGRKSTGRLTDGQDKKDNCEYRHRDNFSQTSTSDLRRLHHSRHA